MPAPCKVDGCFTSTSHGGRGWCPKHYWRWRKHGDPLVAHTPAVERTVCFCSAPRPDLIDECRICHRLVAS